MDNTNKRLAVFTYLAGKNPGKGKTAMMKYAFLLQRVYKVPLGYTFDLYLYGPYTSEVMSDIDYAEQQKYLDVQFIKDGLYNEYKIRATEHGNEFIEQNNLFVQKYKSQIDELIGNFGGKTAKDLELLSTIVYLYVVYALNKKECDAKTVSENVHEIKPRFELSEIQEEYFNLEKLGILSRAAAI